MGGGKKVQDQEHSESISSFVAAFDLFLALAFT
jgi:hypothetical protein